MARIFQRGKMWYVDFSHRGRRVVRSTRQRDRKTAALIAKDIEVKIAKGEYLGIHDQPKILLRDCAEKYLAYSKADKAPNSYERDIISVRVHLVPAFGDYYICDLKPEMIENYKATRLTGVKPATVNREIGCLRNMLNKAIEWGYLTNTPMKCIKPLKEPTERVRYLETHEVPRLLKECSEHLRPIVLCGLHTGMRKGEILNLEWGNVDFDNRMILLDKTKNNRRRMIPMSGVLSSVFGNIRKTGEYVFCNEKGERFGKIDKGFKAACARAGIKDFRFHDLRHTFASHLTMSGCNMRTVQQLLGHTTIRTTMKYAHLSKEHLEEAVNLLGAKLSTEIDTKLQQSPMQIGEIQLGG